MDDNKKPGARDISDLKARLGLKKTNTMAAVTPQGEPGASPPGAPIPSGAVPSPFGAPAAAPAPPPDPRRDPFSAQQQQQAANLAAFYGIGQQLPGSADAVAGSMEKPKPWGLIAAVLVGGLGIFIVGSFWGGISKSRVEFNETTDHAIQIRDEVDKLEKNLASIIAELRRSTAGKVDPDQAIRLASLGLKKPDTGRIFHTNYVHLEGLGMERLFSYYNATIKLYDEIEVHGRKTNADKESITKFLENANRSDKNYGVVVDVGGPIPIAKFVEVGAPVCPKEGQVDCKPDELKGFKYRLEAGANWSEKPVRGKPGETVTPLQQTPLFKSVASGSVDAIAVEAYGRRLKNIIELVGELEKTHKELAADLKKTAERPKVFTF